MRENVGSWDRVLRSFLGPSLLLVGYSGLGGRRGRTGGLAAMIVGAVLTETAITRVCPLNYVLGVNTSDRGRRLRSMRAIRQLRKKIAYSAPLLH